MTLRAPFSTLSLSLGGTATDPGHRSISNPRGWLKAFHGEPFDWDPGHLDARAPDYVERFAPRCLAYCEKAFDWAKAKGCTVVHLRAVEGEEADHGTSYPGEPALGRPPEMTDDLLRKIVKAAADRGLKVGFTVRDSRFTRVGYGKFCQIYAGEPGAVLVFKYWELSAVLGPDLTPTVGFLYYDTNSTAKSSAGGTMEFTAPASVKFAADRIGSKVLIAPERSRPGYEAIANVAPLNWVSAPAYPGKPTQSLVVLMAPPDGVWTAESRQAYATGVKGGGIPVYDCGWPGNPSNAEIDAAREAAGK